MSNLSVKIITWSAGTAVDKSNLGIFNWSNQMEEWTIIWPSHDIIFITFQELSKEAGNQIYDALKRKLPNYRISQDNEGTIIPNKNLYVFGYLCIINTVFINLGPITNDICIYKRLICQNPSVAFGTIVNGKKLIFIASYLPLDLTDKYNNKLGLGDRIESMRKINNELIPNIIKAFGPAAPTKEYTTLFWAGNLNFRIQHDGKEQLDTLLKIDLDESLGKPDINKYKEADRTNLHKTCTYLPYSGTSFDTFRRNRQQGKSYDKSILPSYCDRIIFKGNFAVTKYYSWPERKQSHYPLSIAYSEHEPVILEGFVLSQNAPSPEINQRPKSDIVQKVTEVPVLPMKSQSQPLPSPKTPVKSLPTTSVSPPSPFESFKRRPVPPPPSSPPASPSLSRLPPLPSTPAPTKLSEAILQMSNRPVAPPRKDLPVLPPRQNQPQKELPILLNRPPTYEAPKPPPRKSQEVTDVNQQGGNDDFYKLKYYKYKAKYIDQKTQ
ncbi:MAG: hypothetical protein Barrevirus7_14 [Barrevirus sp.]|uniref:Inositol polyphosphate-related phosphatase domain-containing protein n=1 Tax=Barrevirus sp. TaxID=2487763 RepID=A0A3G4ZQ49_9VIRU|nr:MAG: hypothetical protein Barrevirus7_14 [Barrevirus sp.]